MRVLILLCMVLLFILTSKAQVYLKPSIGVNSLPADTTKICKMPYYTGGFANSGYKAKDTVADFTLYTLTDSAVNLNALLQNSQKPVLLISASYTCPVFRGKIAAINNVIAKYGNALNVFIVYTLEAHPNIDSSIYFARVNTTQQNINEGVLYRNAVTYADRKSVVTDMLAKENIQATVLLDGPCNNWWQTYGPAPNNATLIKKNGIVFTKHAWFDKYPDYILCDIDSLLGISGNCNRGGGGTSTGNFSFVATSSDSAFGSSGNTLTCSGKLVNLNNTSVFVTIMRLQNNLAAGWSASLCADVCYPTNVDTAYIEILPNSEQTFHYYFYSAAGINATSTARIGFRNTNKPSNQFMKNYFAQSQNSTSIGLVEPNFNLEFYPNPAKDFIKFNTVIDEIRVSSINGTWFKKYNQITLLDISEFKSGIYSIEIVKDNKSTFKKLVKF